MTYENNAEGGESYGSDLDWTEKELQRLASGPVIPPDPASHARYLEIVARLDKAGSKPKNRDKKPPASA
jgi:hypothetical protein